MNHRKQRFENGSETKTVKSLIRQNKYIEVAGYCDQINFEAVKQDADWIWEQASEITRPSGKWNSCSYGNLCVMILFGAKFPRRHTEIQRLRQMLSKV